MEKYTVSVLIFSSIGLIFLFLLQILQGVLPGNPNAFTNLIEMLSILLIPAALCFTFGKAIKNKKQGIAIFMEIKRDGKMNLNFASETSFIPGDTILVLGDTKNIQKCFHILIQKEDGKHEKIIVSVRSDCHDCVRLLYNEKASNNAFANSFSDFLFSNQAVINAEYLK